MEKRRPDNTMILMGREAFSGFTHIARGLRELAVGVAEEVDAAAIGLAIIAAYTAGLPLALAVSTVDKNHNCLDVYSKIVKAVLASGVLARFIGYGLLATCLWGIYENRWRP